MNRPPRPRSKTERIARRHVLSYMETSTRADPYREPYRQRMVELDHGSPVSASDMRPVWKARRERRLWRQIEHVERNRLHHRIGLFKTILRSVSLLLVKLGARPAAECPFATDRTLRMLGAPRHA